MGFPWEPLLAPLGRKSVLGGLRELRKALALSCPPYLFCLSILVIRLSFQIWEFSFLAKFEFNSTN